MDATNSGGWSGLFSLFDSPIFSTDTFQSNFWASALGALVGAGSAFLLERIHAAHAQRKLRVSHGNQATHTLSLMFSIIASLENAIFGNYRAKNSGADPHPLEVQGTNDIQAGSLRFNLSELAFLAETYDPDILNRLLMAERRFGVLLDVANRRSRLQLDIQDILGSSGLSPRVVITPAIVATYCGHHRVKQLEDLHNDLLTSLPAELDVIKKLSTDMTNVLKYTFPWSRVITYTTDASEMADYRRSAKPAWWRISARYVRQLTLKPKQTLSASWKTFRLRRSKTDSKAAA